MKPDRHGTSGPVARLVDHPHITGQPVCLVGDWMLRVAVRHFLVGRRPPLSGQTHRPMRQVARTTTTPPTSGGRLFRVVEATDSDNRALLHMTIGPGPFGPGGRRRRFPIQVHGLAKRPRWPPHHPCVNSLIMISLSRCLTRPGRWAFIPGARSGPTIWSLLTRRHC
jgi:hypothetical protein